MEQLIAPAAEMKRLLSFLGQHEASDLHLKVGYPPYVRIGGHLRKLELPPIPNTAFVNEMITPLVPSNRWKEFEAHGSLAAPPPIEEVAFVTETLAEIADREVAPTQGARSAGMVGVFLSAGAPSPLADYTIPPDQLGAIAALAQTEWLACEP